MSKKNLTSSDLPEYQKHFSEDGFWGKIRKIASKAGSKLVYYALVLYYTLMDPATPMKYKAVIAGALGYFILPTDFLPDLLPFAGLADDWGALIAAVSYVISAITPAHREQALKKLKTWFPKVEKEDLGDLA